MPGVSSKLRGKISSESNGWKQDLCVYDIPHAQTHNKTPALLPGLINTEKTNICCYCFACCSASCFIWSLAVSTNSTRRFSAR
jgi:hypothetical protein